jgi:hypothetical protein
MEKDVLCLDLGLSSPVGGEVGCFLGFSLSLPPAVYTIVDRLPDPSNTE